MNKIIFIIFLFITSIFSSMAQQGGGNTPKQTSQEHAASTVSKLSEKIVLTAPQKDSITNTFTSFYDTMKANKEAGSQDKMKAAVSARDAKVKTILADETKYQTYLKTMEENKSQQHGSHPHGGGH